ncbi:MAG: GGDEF domain-containing phosphodiesterase [Halofilum sp. (in: g-proteobacteria)]|nr:GGDEF domain-containing phosphodiesterase [Halofilum sp. (in: g-proteobacteria)]
MPLEHGLRRWFPRLRLRRRVLDLVTVGLIAALFAGATVLVYATGGTKLAWPYLMLVPVLLAAARFRVVGGILGGLVGGLLLGPFMPLDSHAGIAQETLNWIVRIAFYTGLGGFTGLLFLAIHREGVHRERDARIDSDSGLPNKVALAEALRELHAEDPAHSPLLILARVRDLAGIVEAAGVAAADELVRELERRLRAAVGEPARVYRFSASELVLLKPRPDRPADELIELAMRSVEEPVEVRSIPVHVELMFGSAGSGAAEWEPRELIRQTRVALVAAGEHHRAHVHYAPEHERESARTVELLGRVRRGLAAGEFELHYQPKIGARNGAAVGCEALIRWRDRSGALIPPGRFMPGVERSALIDPLTRFVVAEASAFAHRNDARTVSVNFTARNLLDRELVAALGAQLAEGGLGNDRLEVEITEGAIVRDPGAARAAIERLREAGCRVSIDDFGTGYSSFEYLRVLPITGLKIDRAFVRDLEHDQRALDLMASMIQIGHTLGLEVVAEGVEDRAQYEALRWLGCDVIQGFHFAKPMTEHDYRSWHEREFA